MLTLTSSKTAKSASKSNTRNKGKVTVDENKSQLWTDKYRPSCIADLPSHHSKVRAFKDWLEKALEIHECFFDLGASGQTCFLAVVGNAGCGKSSTVQQVCAEHNVAIVEWSDDLWDPESAGGKADWSDLSVSGGASNNSGGGGSYGNYTAKYEAEYGGGYSSTAQSLFKVEGVTWGAHTTKGDTLENFALQSSYPALSLQTKSSSNSRSSGSSRSNAQPTRTQSLSSHTPLTITTSSTIHTTSFQRKIILLKDPPSYDTAHSTHNDNKRSNLYNFLLSVQCPVVMVLSDVSGRDDYMFAVDRCLPPQIKRSLQFESLFFTAVTEARVARVLDHILKSERIERGSREAAHIVQDISASCMGDIRHAVVQLQLLLGNHKHPHNSIQNSTNSTHTVSVPEKIKRSQSLPNPIYNTNSNTSTNSNTTTSTNTSAIHSESTIYDNVPSSALNKNKKQKVEVEVVDLISPPTSPVYISNTSNNNTHINSTANTSIATTYTAPAPSHRRGKRVVYDTDSGDEGSVYANNTTAIVRGVTDGVLVNTTNSVHTHPTTHTTNTHNNTTSSTLSPSTDALHTVSAMSRRDGCYSSLHSVGKLLNATLDNRGALRFDPDSVIERSELSVDLIGAFMQWNWIASVQATPRILPPPDDTATSSGMSTSVSAGVLSEGEVSLLELTELQMALDVFSEIDLYNTRKYDTNAQLDRAGTSLYPDGYIQSLLGRACCASRGVGSAERKEYARSRGHKGSFQGIFRPRVIDVRSQTGAVQSKLRAIQSELLHLPSPATQYSADGSSSGSSQKHTTHYTAHHTANNYTAMNTVGAEVTTNSALVIPLRELLLHTIPYHTAITHALHTTSKTPSLPVYSPRIDWMMSNLYNSNQMYSAVLGKSSGSTGTQVRTATHNSGDAPTDDVISEFE